jgi:benzoyl-CoA reductase/2-hydroxyglutaryl-CoA dehydratase subunit BcrC/BadD/HgdB
MTATDLPERKTYLRQHKAEQQRNVLGVFPAVYPREILWSLDILPVEIWDPPVQAGRSAAHLPPNTCDVVRRGLELILQGHCGDLDGFLFPHTCDSIQNLASIVNDYLGTGKPCFFFHPPRRSDSKAARIFYRRQLESLTSEIREHFGGLYDADALSAAVALGQAIDGTICEIYHRRGQDRLRVGNAEFYKILRAGEYLRPNDYLALLKKLTERTGSADHRQTPVVLSGVLPSPPTLLRLLDDLDLRIAADDFLNCGRRLQVAPVPIEDPYTALTERYFRMPVCPTRQSSLAERVRRLVALVGSTRAAGVIFTVLPFCDPELFDLPPLVAELEKKGIRTLVVEVGLNRQLSGQVTVRVEAFAEMIGSALQ